MFHSPVSSSRARNPKRPAAWLLVFALFITAFAPGAASESRLSSSPLDANSFILAASGEASTLDPALAYDTSSGEVIQNVYEKLVFYNGAKTNVFVPQLANSYGLSGDGLTWTFHIRPGVTFHNGASLTPTDVAYSFQRGLLQGGSSSPQWLLTEPFFGTGIYDISLLVDPTGGLMDDRAALSAADPAVLLAACQEVKAAIVANNAAGTVTMHLAQPWGPFLGIIAGTWGSILDKEWTIAQGGWDNSCNTWQDWYAMDSAEDPLTAAVNGTGPFKLDHWSPGQEIVLTRNGSYWRSPARLEGVIIKIVPDDIARFSMLKTGSVDEARPVGNVTMADKLVGEDCIWNINTAKYDCSLVDSAKSLRRYSGRAGLSRDHVLMNFDISVPAGGNPYIGSGQLDGDGIPSSFFSDVHIRKAFNYCFDWDSYGQAAFDGAFSQATSLALEGMPGYDLNAPHYTHDLTACELELGQADVDQDGIPSASDTDDVLQTGFHFQMPYNEGNLTRKAVAEILSANLAQIDPNFDIEVISLPWSDYLAAQGAGVLPIMTAGWLEDYHDPHNWYVPYLVGTYGSRAHLPEDLKAQFNTLINQGVSVTDFAARHAIYQQLNQLVYDNATFILLGGTTNHNFIQRRVNGQVLNQVFSGNYYYTIYKPLVALSASTYDGWILESTETSGTGGTLNSTTTTFALGDNALNRQYRAILSFSTGSLPDNAVITSATLRIRRQGIVGTDPFTTHLNLLVDLRKGTFGAGALQLGDFQAFANLEGAAIVNKTPLALGWHRAIFKAAALPLINKTGTTQLRLRFSRDDNNDLGADYMNFYSGNAGAANRPQLIIEYHVP
jgi:peptide/nickel transport system substrate-binding protein